MVFLKTKQAYIILKKLCHGKEKLTGDGLHCDTHLKIFSNESVCVSAKEMSLRNSHLTKLIEVEVKIGPSDVRSKVMCERFCQANKQATHTLIQ